MDYVIADTHFYDDSIKRYEGRTVSDEEIIERWNNIVSENDRVFMLGDFVHGGFEEVKNLVSILHGYKILVKGNHDTLTYKEYLDAGFDEVYFYPIIVDGFWMMSHEPIYVTENAPYANIYGHIHNNPSYKDYSSRSFCACVERINYTPIPLNEIKKLVLSEDRKIKNK